MVSSMKKPKITSEDLDEAETEFVKGYVEEQLKREKAKQQSTYIEGNPNWKYSKDGTDLDCLTNWDYYDKDGKTLLAKSIPRLTKLKKNDTWCATRDKTLAIDQDVPQHEVIKFLDANKVQIAGLGISAGVSYILGQKAVSGALKNFSTAASAKLGFRTTAKNFLTKFKTPPKSMTPMIKSISKGLGKGLGKLSAKVGFKTSGNLMKSAMKLKPGPLVAFQILTMALDFADVGGYGKMQTKKGYYDIKSGIDKERKKMIFEEVQKAYQEQGVPFTEDDFQWPMILDPLSEIPSSKLDDLIAQRVNTLLRNPLDPKVLPFFKSLSKDLDSGVLKPTDSGNLDKTKKYLDKIDFDALEKEVFKEFCIANNGVVYDDGNKCSLNEAKCNQNNGQPINENDVYKEFKDGKCVVADDTMFNMCKEAKLPYDKKTGICKITENYCKSKGAEWRYNDKIKEYDCIVPLEQQALEFILGTSITRGMKQIFDPDQYESCGYDGPITTSRGCVSPETNKLMKGSNLTTKTCDKKDPLQDWYYNSKDKTIHSMIDYKKCWQVSDPTNKVGSTIKLMDCNNSDSQKFTYDKTTHQLKPKPKDENSDESEKCVESIFNKSGKHTLVLSECDYKNVSRKIRLTRNKIIESSYTCDFYNRRPADCPAGYTNNGLTCGRGADRKTSDFGLGYYESADCPAGYTNTGTTCHRWGSSFEREYFFRAGKSKSYDMEQCEKKYGKGNCEQGGPWGSVHTFPKCEIEAAHRKEKDPKGFKSDKLWTMGARCHLLAHTIGSIDKYGKCPPSNDKKKEYTQKRGGLCYVDCEKKYGKGYYNNGTGCFRNVHTTGTGPMTCKSHEKKISSAGSCSIPCPPTFTNLGATCNRRKYRKIDFSK